MKRYEVLAARLTALIRQGSLQPGTRLPSVREAARHYQVSQDTVYRAYYLLEGNGVIFARPRVGYFVSTTPASAQRTTRARELRVVPKPARGRVAPADAFVFSVYERLAEPGVLPFGASYPGAGLFPYAALARSLASGARTLKPTIFTSGLSNGYGPLREQIATRYRSRGLLVSSDDVLITGGASEAIALCLQCLTAPGDMVLVEDPCFHGTLYLLDKLSLRHVAVPVHPQQGIDLERLDELLAREPVKACVLMSNVQHPTGVSMTDATRRELVRLLAHHAVPLIEDDVYSELGFLSVPASTALVHDTAGTVLSCGSFSKSLAPGYRIGWVVALHPLIERIRRLRLVTTITPSVPVQVGISHYLQRGGYDRHLRALRKSLSGQLQHMQALIAEYFPGDCTMFDPAGGYFGWMRLPRGRSAMQVARRALDEGISVMPGGVFSRTSDLDNYLRLNYGHPWDARLEAGMRKLGRLVTKV